MPPPVSVASVRHRALISHSYMHSIVFQLNDGAAAVRPRLPGPSRIVVLYFPPERTQCNGRWRGWGVVRGPLIVTLVDGSLSKM